MALFTRTAPAPETWPPEGAIVSQRYRARRLRAARPLHRPALRPSLTVRTRAAVMVAAAVTITVIAVLKAGHWTLYADRHRIHLTPVARRSCPDCRGEGGWWVGGANPEMEACGCWATRRELRIRLLPVPAWPDEPPF